MINPDDKLNLTREEVFGPVVNLIRVASAEEALSKANDTDFGLTASLWTTSLQKAMALTPRIQAGTVWVNTHTLIDPNMPFGGFKQSGSGRDFGGLAGCLHRNQIGLHPLLKRGPARALTY